MSRDGNGAGSALRLVGVERTYKTEAGPLTVLRDASFAIGHGELVGLVAPSGAGKSTLLHVAGLLERPNAGDVLVDEKPCGKLNDINRTLLRRRTVGFVYQFHHLLPEFSALENVMIPQMIGGASKRAAKTHARELLDAVGLGNRANHRPAKLSGGEQQRVAVARAVANDPTVLLADEPTGNLDPATADRVFDTLLDLVRKKGMSALIATHNLELAHRMDRVLTFDDGAIVPYKG